MYNKNANDLNYLKYIKYKLKYINLKNEIGGNKNIDNYDFYFIHKTKNINSLKSILKSGILKLGKDVSKRYRGLSGTDPTNYIYANMFFEDLKNISHMWDISIILHPKIFYEYDIEFNQGWGYNYPKNNINIYKNDDIENKKKKLEEIKEFTKNPHTLPKVIREFPGMMHHQVVFKENIPLKNNLLGLVCNMCPENEIKKIKKIIKNKPYKNIKIYEKNYPFPSFKELLE